MRKMTSEEEMVAAELFRLGKRPPPHEGEGETHLTVRFDSTRPGVVYYGPHARDRKIRIPGALVLRYEINHRTHTQSLMVRTRDGRRWTGTSKSGTDVVLLRRVEAKEEK